jgi:pantoate--beta-alanine ligase
MEVFNTKNQLNEYLLAEKGAKIGFVPTMGALHEGHISLITQSKLENNVTIASIFVNPTQFNNKQDLEKYPRTVDADKSMLENAGCDAVFIPFLNEMYTEDELNGKTPSKTDSVNLGIIETVMEGEHRPGHFAGVMQVVSKLFDIVKPTNAYFGQKDFQQLAVIRTMAKQMKYPIKIVACPTLREADGLAMSSRNRRILNENRETAAVLSQVLFKAKQLWQSATIDEIKKMAANEINKHAAFKLEYFEMADAETLQPVLIKENPTVACVAAWLGDVRLIDNILL